MNLAPSELILTPEGAIYHLQLKPEELCDTIITVGDPERVKMISKHFDKLIFERHHREFVIHKGLISHKEILVMSTGMGTDNIDIVLNELDALANIDFASRTEKERHRSLNIIRVGTSGSISEHIKPGTLLISEAAIGMDSLMQFYPHEESHALAMEELKEQLGINMRPYFTPANVDLLNTFSGLEQGITLTCPGFYGPQGRNIRIAPRISDLIIKASEFKLDGSNITNLEMETAGYYSLGKILGHRCISLNAILASRKTGEFDQDANHTINSLILFVLSRIGNL